MVLLLILYANDTQMYISTMSNIHHPPLKRTKCLQDVNVWMTKNFLKLNINTTEVLLVGFKSTLSKIQSLSLLIYNC